ncbi:MAG: SpoIIIAH-like family protein [Ruminococcaceae bacterium]|nr:SpoIIIAH-like family protein [Oscillospiraceae bacterium]
MKKFEKLGKKQITLAALILALGATVYLNWQFTSPSTVPVSTQGTEYTENSEEKSEYSPLGIAELVNSSYIDVETVNDEIEAVDEADVYDAYEVSSSLSQARLDRQNSRESALELLDEVLNDVEADSEAKKKAIDEASIIAQNMVKESNIETLIKAKGINDVVVYLSDDGCSIIVDKVGDNILAIQDIITKETSLTTDKITVTEIG